MSENASVLIDTRVNYIHAKRFDNSLKKLIARYPDGVPDRIIAQALLMTEEDVQVMWDVIVEKLRLAMAV